MNCKTVFWITLGVSLVLAILGSVYISVRHRTEAGFPIQRLADINQIPDKEIASVYLRQRKTGMVRTLERKNPEDRVLIRKLKDAFRTDLWVSSREVNPNKDGSSPIYDQMQFRIVGKHDPLCFDCCWLGREGNKNPSLTLRTKTGAFNKVTHDIMKRAKPIARSK